MAFDRYSQVRDGNTIGKVPFAEIAVRSTDFYEIYRKGEKRLDQISYDYYGNSDYGWVILQANPQYGAMEYNIPDGKELRIPYPLEAALSDYQRGIENYKKYYK